MNDLSVIISASLQFAGSEIELGAEERRVRSRRRGSLHLVKVKVYAKTVSERDTKVRERGVEGMTRMMFRLEHLSNCDAAAAQPGRSPQCVRAFRF